MSRKLFAKLFITLSIITLLVLIVNSNVKATTSNSTSTFDQIINTDEKIMKYDALTNQTTEVDLEELQKVLKLKKGIDSNTCHSTEPYNPPFQTNLLKTSISHLATGNSVTRITNTFQFPYQTTCRVTANNSRGGDVYSSAAIVGSHAVLTAAHCVFDPTDNNAVFKN